MENHSVFASSFFVCVRKDTTSFAREMLLFAQIYGIIHTIRDVLALKEANETGKWIEMLLKTDYIDEATYKSFDKTCSTICILLIASIKTAKGNSK